MVRSYMKDIPRNNKPLHVYIQQPTAPSISKAPKQHITPQVTPSLYSLLPVFRVYTRAKFSLVWLSLGFNVGLVQNHKR